jgi:hypothetical protein
MPTRPFGLRSIMTVLLVALLLIAACDTKSDKGKDAADFLPKMNKDDYDVVSTDALQDALTTLEVWTAVSGQFAFTAQIATVDAMIECAQETGSLAIRAYSYKANRLVAGTAIVVNYDRLTSWETAVQCFGTTLSSLGRSPDPEIRPCASWWQYEEDGTTYYMLQAGTSPMICEQMCSSMSGCASNDMIAAMFGG